VTGSVTSFDTPRIVSVPVTSYWSFPFGTILVLLKVISGFFAASKKSAERRWLSRSALFVSIEAALIVKFTDEASGLAGSAWIAPEKSAKRPRTLDAK
jgi:hypothetical protein